MRTIALIISLVGTLLFGGAFALSFAEPITIERVFGLPRLWLYRLFDRCGGPTERCRFQPCARYYAHRELDIESAGLGCWIASMLRQLRPG